jgi:hypothetical protein
MLLYATLLVQVVFITCNELLLASMAWTMWFFYGWTMRLPMLASMIHLWATIRGRSYPVTNSLSGKKACETPYVHQVPWLLHTR